MLKKNKIGAKIRKDFFRGITAQSLRKNRQIQKISVSFKLHNIRQLKKSVLVQVLFYRSLSFLIFVKIIVG